MTITRDSNKSQAIALPRLTRLLSIGIMKKSDFRFEIGFLLAGLILFFFCEPKWHALLNGARARSFEVEAQVKGDALQLQAEIRTQPGETIRKALPVVRDNQPTEWTVEISPVERQNRLSQGTSLCVLDIATDQESIDFNRLNPSKDSGWVVEPASWAPRRYTLVNQTGRGSGVSTVLFGKWLKISYIAKEQAGVAQITLNGIAKEIDFHSPSPIDEYPSETFTAPSSTPMQSHRYIFESIPNDDVEIILTTFPPGDLSVKGLPTGTSQTAPLSDQTFAVLLPKSELIPRSVSAGTLGIILFCGLVLTSTTVRLFIHGGGRYAVIAHCIASALLLTTALILVFFPGLATHDTVLRWLDARHLLQGARVGSQSPPMMAAAIALVYDASGQVWVFAFLGGFLFLLLIQGILFSVMTPRAAVIAAVCVCALPPVWNFAVGMLTDVWVTIGLIGVALILIHACRWKRLGLIIVATVGLACFGSILFSFRYNAISVLPPLLIAIATAPLRLSRRTIYAISLMAGIVLKPILVSQFVDHTQDHVSWILAWEHVGTLQKIGDPEALQKYNLDFAGNTDAAASKFDPVTLNNLLSPEDGPLSKNLLTQNSGEVKRRFFDLIKAYPLAYLKTKLEIWRSLLGLTRMRGHTPGMWRVPTPRLESGELLDVNVRSLLPKLYGILIKVLLRADADWRWLYIPIISILCGAAAALLVICVDRRRRFDAIVLLVASIGYYGGFFVVTPSFSFRYYLPSFVLNVILVAMAVELTVIEGRSFIRPRG